MKEVETLVDFFNKNGLKVYSCYQKPDFQIVFNSSVTEDDLFNFMSNHVDKESDVFQSRGRFAKRLGYRKLPFYEFYYLAKNEKMANMDLKDFQEREKNV